jgi:hypothetical protein
MTPATLALELLTRPALIRALESSRDREPDFKRCEVTDLAEEVTLSLSRAPAHQVRHAATRIKLIGNALPLTLLSLLAREHLGWTRGELRLRHTTYLRWRSAVSARISVDLLWATAMAVECLEEEWTPTLQADNQHSASRLHARDILTHHPPSFKVQLESPLIPSVSLLMLDPLRQQGLPEPHRHQSLARLPDMMWCDLLFGDEDELKVLKDENMRAYLALARRLRRAMKDALALAASHSGQPPRSGPIGPPSATAERSTSATACRLCPSGPTSPPKRPPKGGSRTSGDSSSTRSMRSRTTRHPRAASRSRFMCTSSAERSFTSTSFSRPRR